MVRILAAAFAPPAGALRRTSHQIVATLAADGWRAGCETRYLAVATTWWSASETIQNAARQADAVLLLADGAAPAGLEVSDFAVNEADGALADANGARWPGGEIVPNGPPFMRATLRCAPLCRALEFAGVPAQEPRPPPVDIANRCLFAVLTMRNPPLATLLRLPPAMEGERERGAAAPFNRMQLLSAVKAALTFAAAAAEATHAA